MVCRNCGKCCWYNLNGKDKLCKYIKINNDNTTFCTIYSERIGTVIDKEILDYNYNNTGLRLVKRIICGYRKNQNRYINGCIEMNPKILVGISVINSVHTIFLKELEDSRREWRRNKHFFEVLWDDHVPLDYSRNIIVKNALLNKADYILFLDSDIKLPNGTLDKLLAHDKDIVTGVYYWKGPPYIPIIMKNANDLMGYNPIMDFDNYEKYSNPMEIDGTGFGCCLVKTDVFRNIGYPWFKNEWIQERDENNNLKEPQPREGDLNFCKLLQRYQYKIYADNTIICPHWGTYVTKEIVDKLNTHVGGYLKNGEQPIELIKYIVDKFKPGSVLDVGCGPFGAIKIFNSLGIDVYGLDGDVALLYRKDLTEYLNKLCINDLEISGYKYPNKFDMVFSYETAEHIANVNNYIDTLVENCSSILVMTHGLPGQEGYHHVNCQNDDYWIDLITKKEFKYLENETVEARLIDDKYFKQSGLIFRRGL